MVLLTIKIKDWVYTKDIALPTTIIPAVIPAVPSTLPSCIPIWTCELPLNSYEVNQCTTQRRINPICNEPIIKDTQIVKIISDGNNLPSANEGEIVTISATVNCLIDNVLISQRGKASLIIDGAVTDEQQIQQGEVKFEWIATALPVSVHSICIMVQPSKDCKAPGKDCKRIYVNPVILSPSEQLARERSSANEQRRLLAQQKRKLREEIIESTVELPGEYIPETITGSIIPDTAITESIIPDTGSVIIGTIPSVNTIPISINDKTTIIYLYIDNIRKGDRITDPSNIISNIPSGNHTAYLDITYKHGTVDSKFRTPTILIYIFKGVTTTINF